MTEDRNPRARHFTARKDAPPQARASRPSAGSSRPQARPASHAARQQHVAGHARPQQARPQQARQQARPASEAYRAQARPSGRRPSGKRPGGTGAPGGRNLVVIGAGLLVVLLIAFFLVPRCTSALFGETQKVESGKRVSVRIPDGASGADIARVLFEAGVIANEREFKDAVHAKGAESSMKSGTFELTCGDSLDNIVSILSAGSNSTANRITVAEGLTLQKTAAAVEQQTSISASDFLAQAKASNYVSSYPFLAEAANDSLEGFLYPKTYDFDGREVTADAIIRDMLDQYAVEIADVDLAGARSKIKAAYNLDLTNYDILKVASIIEREAISDTDRPLVASAIYNRLRDGMALQSDATMGYVTGGEVTAEDLTKESPYNTYLNQGLTPTPICTPGLEALKAAADPATTNYKYFLIIENGSYSNHTFSETYEEHERAIEKAKSEGWAA